MDTKPERFGAPELIVDNRDGCVVVTLARPKALNALSAPMYRVLYDALPLWAADPGVRMVVVRGAGGRAFSAGGDIRMLFDAIDAGNVAPMAELFRIEYTLNRLVHRFPKPWVALMDGIAMGGGCGIAVHGSWRVVSERTVLAMPETAIGFFPDVGATWFLSRCPGESGVLMGLLGERLGPADAVWAGLADAYVPSDRLGAVVDALAGGGAPAAVLGRLAEDPGESGLGARRAAIDHCFGGETVEAILAACERAGEADWAGRLRALPPFGLKVTLAALRAGRRLATVEECLTMEYRLCRRLLERPDLREGIRCAVVDKGAVPVWAPTTLAGADPAAVAACFSPLGRDDLTW